MTETQNNSTEGLPADEQQQLLAVFAFYPEGKTLLEDIQPALYTAGTMRDIATVIAAHWKEFDAPPGPVELPNLFKNQITGKNGALISQVLDELLNLANDINPSVVLNHKDEFVLRQRLMNAVITAHKKIDAGKLFEAEQILRDATEEKLNGNDAPGMETVCAADVKMRAVAWVWPGRIPRGKQTSIVGDPEGGKTTVALDVVARITRGSNWPDGAQCPQGNVLFVSAEDDIEDTLAPRLEAAGADRNCVQFLKVFRKKDPVTGMIKAAPFSLSEVEALRGAIEKIGNVCAVIFDPAMAYVGGRADANKNSDVRGLLGPLNTLAAEQHFALIFVDHLNKSISQEVMYRIGGSIAWVANARSALLVVKDPEDETGERRLLLRLKCNLAKDPGGLAFILEPTRVRQLGGQEVVRTKWLEGAVTQTARDVLSASAEPVSAKKVDETEKWLTQRLTDGPVPADTIKKEAKVAGISLDTLKRAKKQAKVTTQKEHTPDGEWTWRLPVLRDVPSSPSEGMNGYINKSTPSSSSSSSTPSSSSTSSPIEGAEGAEGAEGVKGDTRPPLRRILRSRTQP